MEEELKTFLRSRGLDTKEIINKLLEDKVDIHVIALMNDENLQQYFCKYGDRLAISDFCRKKKSASKKSGILERLRRKINRKSSTGSEESGNEGSGGEKLHKKKRMNATKTERQIEIGWFCSINGETTKQVRTKCGGGTRKITVPKDAKKSYILAEAEKLFFPSGVSTKGPKENFEFDLWDFKSNTLSDDMTVEDLFKITGLSRVRFHLASIQKDLKTNHPDSRERCETVVRPSTPQSVSSSNMRSPSPDLQSFIIQDDTRSYYESAAADVIVLNENGELLENNLTFDVGDFIPDSVYLPDEANVLMNNNVGNESILLKLHRGQCFDELLSAFATLDKNCGNLQIEMYLPNGQKEVAFDMGGLFRDALSEFFDTFYEKCTVGTSFKVPIIRHDFDSSKWKAIAKIIYKGWTNEHYFPIKLAPSFMEYCLFNDCKSDLTDQFLKYINNNDAEVISTSLTKWDEVDEDELIQILDTFQCKWQIKADNIAQIIKDISHKEIIQRPMYIIDTWNEILKDMINEDQLTSIYKQKLPNAKNILPLLTYPDNISQEEITIVKHLQQYIKEADSNTLEAFVRFCTGANMLTAQKIIISFNNTHGVYRTPIGHTCSNTLEISKTYENFNEFRHSMNLVLHFNIWVMDII